MTLNYSYDPVNIVSTNGDNPVHISIDSRREFLVVSNYGSGSFIVYGLEKGIPVKPKFFVSHEGSGKHPEKQLSPHPHCSLFSSDSQILFVTDLGTDIIYYYDVNSGDI